MHLLSRSRRSRFYVNPSMKRLVAFGTIFCGVFIGYFTLYPPFGSVTVDDIPRPSCTEMMMRQKVTTNTRRLQSNDIMTTVRVTSNKGYTEFTSSVIRQYQDIATQDIHVFTNGLHDYETTTLRRMYGENINIFQSATEAAATKKMFEFFIGSRYKILFLIDSEMVFLRSWRDFITQHMIVNKLHFISLYHSAVTHDYAKDCDDVEGSLCRGHISGKLGVAVNKYLAKTVQQKYPKFGDFQYDWNDILRNEGLVGWYPTHSLIMRIGQTNQDKNFCGNNEVPYGFKLCQLPCWIRNGIEFYFDLCTNPQEIYSRETSIQKASSQNRSWVRPVIAYSFYGNKARYVNGALDNAKRIFSIYPGWKIWVYLDDSVANDVIQQLCSDNVKFINMTGSNIKNQMSWRFLIAAEHVKWFQILDIDYRMLKRGKDAADEWLQSGRKFHVMRDHPEHSVHAMNGQMWGGYGNSIPNMKALIKEYRGGNWFMMDIHFLTSKIWPIVKKSVWVHDAYPLHKFGQDRPFPSKRIGKKFVGNVDFQ